MHALVSVTGQMADIMPNFPYYYILLVKQNSPMIYDYHVIATLTPTTELLRNKYKTPLYVIKQKEI